MNYDIDRWYVNYYRWFYDVYSKAYLPTNFCTFWRKLILAFILFPIVAVFNLPKMIMEWKFTMNHENTLTDNVQKNWIFWVIVVAVIGNYYICVYSLSNTNATFWLIKGVIFFAVLFDFVAALITVILLLLAVFGGLKKGVQKIGDSTLLGDYIRAKKKKICPKITWVDSEGPILGEKREKNTY